MQTGSSDGGNGTGFSSNSQPFKLRPGVCTAIFVLSGATALGGVMRAMDLGTWDWETLLFFLGAAIILLLPSAAKIEFKKDGVTIEMPESAKELGIGGKRQWIGGEAKSLVPLASPKPKSDEEANVSRPMAVLGVPPSTGTTKPDAKRTFRRAESAIEEDEDDPQKGRWGGLDLVNGRRLSAVVKPIRGSPDWYSVSLAVTATDFDRPLTGEVVFHLHPTFKKDAASVKVENNRAELELVSWGAFTVGAECDGGATKLELDLAALRNAPKKFKEN